MIFRRFPYTTLNDINLDWIIKQVKQIAAALQGKQDKPDTAGVAGQVLGLDENLNPVWLDQSGGGGGTTNYNNLTNKPQINGITLTGNKTAADLGLARASDIPAVPVQSVNGETGAVVLGASDVGALPSTTYIPSASFQLPLMDGEASYGTSFGRFAMEGHVHPTDTSRASVESLATYIRPNLLDNWFFVGGGSQLGHGVFPINQRTQTAYLNAGYCCDRWQSYENGTNTLQADAIYITRQLSQKVEISSALSGNVVSISVLFQDGTLLTTSGTANFSVGTSTLVLATSIDNYANVMLYWDGGSMFFQINIIGTRIGTDTGIVAAKLEIGPNQTLARSVNNEWMLNEIPVYSDQLYKCQQYYKRYSGQFQYCGMGVAFASAGSPNVRILLPTGEMASNPQVTLSGSIYLTNGNHMDNNSIVCTSIDAVFGKSPYTKVNFNAAGLVDGETYEAQFRDAASYIEVYCN